MGEVHLALLSYMEGRPAAQAGSPLLSLDASIDDMGLWAWAPFWGACGS